MIIPEKILLTSWTNRATISDVEYTYWGGFGCIISSIESGVKKDQVRYVGNVLFYAFSVERIYLFSRKRKVNWSVPGADCDFLNRFHSAMFEK